MRSNKDWNQKLSLAYSQRNSRIVRIKQRAVCVASLDNLPIAMVLFQGILQRTHTIMFRFGMFRFGFPEDE